MTLKGKLNFGGTELLPESSAEGLKISDVEKFRYKLQATAPEKYFDVAERYHWEEVGSPTISTANAKWDNALQVSNGNYIQSKEKILLGGRDFTVDLWLQCNEVDNTVIFSVDSLFGFGCWAYANDLYTRPYVKNSANSNNWGNELVHVEFAYKHDENQLYTFKNGEFSQKWNLGIDREGHTITLGGSGSGAISEFRILDGVCTHTENFSVPTTKYHLKDWREKSTVSLLQF